MPDADERAVERQRLMDLGVVVYGSEDEVEALRRGGFTRAERRDGLIASDDVLVRGGSAAETLAALGAYALAGSSMMEEKLILSDQGLWGLLNGRGERRAERVESLLRRLADATHGVNTRCDIELIVRIRDPGSS